MAVAIAMHAPAATLFLRGHPDCTQPNCRRALRVSTRCIQSDYAHLLGRHIPIWRPTGVYSWTRGGVCGGNILTRFGGSYVHGSAGRSRSPTQKRAPPALSNPTPSGKTPDGRPCPPRGWLPQPFRAPPRRTSTAAAYPLKDLSTESLLMQISR